MQRGPPRARDSSLEQSEITAGPPSSRSCSPAATSSSRRTRQPRRASSSMVLRLRSVEQDQPGREGEGVGAVGPLLALLVDRLVAPPQGTTSSSIPRSASTLSSDGRTVKVSSLA